MTRVLVTGGTGFVGRQTLDPLAARGFEVHATRRSSRAQRTPNKTLVATAKSDHAPIIWHEVDLLEPSACETLLARVRPTHLLHLAWFVTPGLFWKAADNLDWVAASLRLLRAFARNGGQRVVSAGTCAEYDWSEEVLDERSTPLNPSNLYGVSKNALRAVQDAWALEQDISAAWGRIFFIYGPAEPPTRLVSSIVRSLLLGQPARTSDGLQVRDFLHTYDLGDAFAALLDSTATGSLNLASGDGVAIRDVALKIARTIDREELLELGALPSRDGEPARLVASVERLRQEVDWQPRLDLDTGLRQTIGWWRRQLDRNLAEQRS